MAGYTMQGTPSGRTSCALKLPMATTKASASSRP
ncbi:Uncharacterised protein [Bordetella pertussis]|nr:Uncharacterised protein [Bordetella pertussis]